MNPRSLILPLLAVLVVGLSVAVASRAGSPRQPAFRGTAYLPAEAAYPFRLQEHTGRAVSLEDYRGSTVLLFFGFTHCPDVCPTTLTRLSRAIRDAGVDTAAVRVLLVTVDPERDTAPVLADYVARFGTHVRGLTGAPDALQAVQKAYGVYSGPHPMHADMSLTHTPAVFGIDREGRLRLLLPMDEGDEAVASDIRALAGL